jgi:Resolvase, N terminal domain
MARRVEHPARGWAGTYGRLSMLPRFTQTHSPENQDRLNKQAALTHGLKIKPGYEFYDEESAYRNVRRRDFERAIAALLNQEIEALIVPKLDRLSRRGMGQVGCCWTTWSGLAAGSSRSATAWTPHSLAPARSSPSSPSRPERRS